MKYYSFEYQGTTTVVPKILYLERAHAVKRTEFAYEIEGQDILALPVNNSYACI